MASTDNGVLIIYTGGTIGSVPRDDRDPMSPLVPASLSQIFERLPRYDRADRKIAFDSAQVRLGEYSWETPLDSSNISLSDWQDMAHVVKEHYEDYEGFVILHGTDTLAFTASALSFMLENLQKPVIITGSQLPIGRTRSDAVQNLVTAIEIAAARTLGQTVIPEVCVYFRDSLLRGCRTTKLDASGYTAFISPNYPVLASVGEHIVTRTRIRSADQTAKILRVKDSLDSRVAVINLFPGMDPALLRAILTTPDLRGVVLRAFGTGNAPSTPEFLESIEQAVKGGKVIVDVTQCVHGGVELGLYDVSAGLLARGVVSGADMTTEAAVAKLFMVLGSEPDIDVAADLMQLNMKGEQNQSIYNIHYGPGETPEDDSSVVVRPLRPMVEGESAYADASLKNALLRIMGLETADGRRGRIEFRVFIDDPSATVNTPTAGNPRFIGEASKMFREEHTESYFVSMTDQARTFISSRHQAPITIVPLSVPLRWEKLNIALFCNGDV